MALSWVTEPSDVEAAVGGSFGVDGEIKSDFIYAIYGNSNNFIENDFSTEGSTGVSSGWDTDTLTVLGTSTIQTSRWCLSNKIFSNNFKIKTSITINTKNDEYYFPVHLIRTISGNYRLRITYDPTVNRVYVDELINGNLTKTDTGLQFNDLTTIQIEVTSTSVVINNNITIDIIGYNSNDKYTCVSSVLDWEISINSLIVYNYDTTFTLTDDDSNTIDTITTTDTTYNYTKTNVQLSDAGTWKLTAENNGETIESEFEVDVVNPVAPIGKKYFPVNGNMPVTWFDGVKLVNVTGESII